ncbi:hypothetical protein SERLADRAFT_453125 [Serpula lacrymans var. lacrymans S7.9]|uniref:Uncharacterized protein n=1 Tax=Serpula lacrymans var. lacrymans (strain S7.9) TaxID=578457 RepID=F8PAG0_SERL9|nr:uncharacterized protein SERLADRAFT_453125 [Serpula lacrymans var. lacrymans S7.9]EGO19799.1 hypothetical protein SERLADRAFT_453125 [Serpula lacrymans var. lacrymans S7.9]
MRPSLANSRPTGENFSLYGLDVTDPFAPRRSLWVSFSNAILATALFRCWHILIFFGAWSTAVCVISNNVYSLAIQPTLITVFGTVLGFVISYRTTSSFERYNEGRRLWSQIVLGSRTFARTVWFHVPDDEQKSRILIEKKTVVNLLEAYAVAIKHYLRGEDGIYYADLYHLVKFLPSYALPPGIPSALDLSESADAPCTNSDQLGNAPGSPLSAHFAPSVLSNRPSASKSHLPLPSTTRTRTTSFAQPSIRINGHSEGLPRGGEKMSTGPGDDASLFPARMPPRYSLFDLFPFSLLVRQLTKSGLEVKGKKAARMRATLRHHSVSHNIPLEISFYLSSYISALQFRKGAEAPTISLLLATLGQLVDALTGLERILTTPIPFSSVTCLSVGFSQLKLAHLLRYSIHLWLVTSIYCVALPFQIWLALKWLTIPATVIASFIFFGFLVAGEEIESNELRAITALPAPDPAVWAFSPENDLLFASRNEEQKVSPVEWLQRGLPQMQAALSLVTSITFGVV